MIKGYFVHIPPLFSDVLADVGNVSKDSDFDDIVEASYSSWFNFWTPVYITSAFATILEKFILSYYIMRRIGSGNVKKFRQLFKNKWREIMPYYERILETIEKENNYFENPILTADIHKEEDVTGTLDETQDTTHNADTDFTTDRNLVHEGSDTKSHDETWSENGNSVEINRYLDTPQSNANRVWETDGQGHLKLSDYYLTDIRGITNEYSKQGAVNWDEAGTNEHTDDTKGHDVTDLDETGQKVTDQDTTRLTKTDKKGYDGYSPADLLMRYRDTFTRTFEDIAVEFEEIFYNLVEVDDLIDYV